MYSHEGMSPTKIFLAVVAVVVMIATIVFSGMLVENVDAEEIVVIQSPISGKLTWYTAPGFKWQGFGKVSKYQKRSIYEFQSKIRFNDGGHGEMHGSIQYEMPIDEMNLNALHVRFGSSDAVQKQLVETVVNKSIYMTGPLMSSKESYAERRNSLIHFVEDQVENGVYQTTQREARIKDPITGAEKSTTIVEIVADKNGLPRRQEEAVLTGFGIKPFNFAILSLEYDEAVERQIQQQQQLAMDVQTAIAESKKAEQRTITVAEQGKANAASAKWEQEVLKAKAVTEAQQQKEVAELEAEKRLQVAKLDAAAAAEYKNKKLLEAEADAEYKKQVLAADGALQQKLEAYQRVNQMYAQAIAQYQGNWVPQFVGGSSDGSGSTTPTGLNLIDLLTAKTARDLSLDMSVKK